MAQQALQESFYPIREEGRGELPLLGQAAVMQYHYLQENNFGMGS
jgi:hypothetical protein